MDNKKQIVFLESYSSVLIYKIACEFRKRGYKTVLIRILEPNKNNKKFYDNGYDMIIDLGIDYGELKSKQPVSILKFLLKKSKPFISALIQIKKLKPYVVIGRATPSWPIALFKRFFKNIPLIYYPTDIRALYYPTQKIAMEKGNLSLFEIKSERFCFEKSDGIMNKNSKEELEHINGRMLGNDVKLPSLRLTFHPYCSDDFIVPINNNKLSKKDKEIHFVYLGTTGAIDKEVYYNSLLKFASDIISQKMHFHTYISSNTNYIDKKTEQFIEKNKTTPNFDYFHIHESLDPKKIVKEISKYDFGLWNLYDEASLSKYDLDYIYAVGNKLSTYFEAGLPVFHPPKLEFLDNLLKKYKIDLPLTSEKGQHSIKNLKKRIKKINYRQMEKKIVAARKDFNLQKHFRELEDFIEKVAQSRKIKK